MAENRRDGSNPPDFNPFAFNPLAGGTPDVMRRYNPNNLLPPETVKRMKLSGWLIRFCVFSRRQMEFVRWRILTYRLWVRRWI